MPKPDRLRVPRLDPAQMIELGDRATRKLMTADDWGLLVDRVLTRP